MADGSAAVVLGLFPLQSDGLVVEVCDLWLAWLAWRSWWGKLLLLSCPKSKY